MRVGIVGAGVTGLAAAWDLVRAGHEVHLYEAEPTVGGLAGGFRDAGWAWSVEKFYHHWFTTDHDLLALAAETGLRDNVVFLRPRTSYWLGGRPVQSEMNASALKLPLPFHAIVQVGLAGVFLKYLVRDGTFLEDYTAHDWMQLYMGRPAYETFFRPLLIGKFGERYDQVNMAWLWARIHTRSVRLGTYQGGFQRFLDDLAAAVTRAGAHIHLGAPVTALGMAADTRPQLTVGGTTDVYDQVLATTSPSLLLRLAPALRNTAYGDQAAALESIGAVCVVLALKQQLLTDGTYWLNLPATGTDKARNPFPFLALVEHTNFLDAAHFGGDHIVYAGDYLPTHHPNFALSDDDLVALYTARLGTFNPAFTPDWIRKAWVFRAPYAQPIPTVGHSQRLPDTTTPLPGVHWASMSHVYPYDRGTNFAVELGRRVAKQMLAGPSP